MDDGREEAAARQQPAKVKGNTRHGNVPVTASHSTSTASHSTTIASYSTTIASHSTDTPGSCHATC
jgi:hypothetical protein